MIRSHFSKRTCSGLSLMELIIAMFVVSIISFGVISAYNSAGRQGVDSFTAANASLVLDAAMTNILNDAFQATGKGTDRGIRIATAVQAGDNSSFCIRTTAPMVGVAANWICYTNSSGVLTTDGNLFTCQRTSLAPCVSSDAGYRSLGTMRCNGMPTFSVVTNPVGSKKMLFTIALSIADSSLNGGRRIQSASISPPAHST